MIPSGREAIQRPIQNGIAIASRLRTSYGAKLTSACFAIARPGTSPSVAHRLSDSLTPRAPCRWRAVVGRVDQRSAADASPNHRRLLLGIGHLPSLSSVVGTYPLMRSVGGMRKAYPDSVALILHSPRRTPIACRSPIGDLPDRVWMCIGSSSNLWPLH
jgi:hypothetical protein